MNKNFDLFFTLTMTPLDVHYITVKEENKLRLDHVIFIV